MIIRTKHSGYLSGNNRLYPGDDSPPPPPSNTSSTVTQTTIPEYARPYVERMLGKAEALSNAPYQAYGGQRIADFSDLQQQSFEGAKNLGPAQQIGQGSQLALGAGLGSLGAGSQYNSMATNPYATQAFMSPYMQNALAPQMREAARNSELMGQQNAAKAVGAGAFGGSRFGLQEAERQRNLGQQQSDIYGKGMQTAFEQARQAQQFGADLGLRGYGQALQSAGQLGQLGQNQYNQQLGAIQAQGAVGGQQQALEQSKLTQQYQDFLTQRGAPQQNLAFMSDILRGVPLGQSTQQQFTAAPSMASNVASLGLGAYGMSQMFGGNSKSSKEGGIVGMANGGMVGMAGGGIASGVSPEKLQAMLRGMGDAKQGGTDQLAAMKEGATDALTLALIQEEERRRELMRIGEMLGKPQSDTTVKEDEIAASQGIEGIPVPEAMFADTAVGEQAPQEEAPQEQEMARGGIVAFKDKGAVKAPAMSPSQRLAAFDPRANVIDSQAEMAAARDRGIADYKKAMGEDEVSPILAEMQKAAGPDVTEQDLAERRAMMAFQAIGDLQGEAGRPAPTLFQGLGKAAGNTATRMAEYKKLDKAAKNAALGIKLESAKLARAEKKENFAASEKAAERLAAHQEDLKKLELQQAHFVAQDAREGQKISVQAEANKISKVTDFRTQAAAHRKDMIYEFAAKAGRPPNEAELAKIERLAGTQAAYDLKQGSLRQGDLDIKSANANIERLKAFKEGRGYRDYKDRAKKAGKLQEAEAALEREYMNGGDFTSLLEKGSRPSGSPMPKGWSVETN